MEKNTKPPEESRTGAGRRGRRLKKKQQKRAITKKKKKKKSKTWARKKGGGTKKRLRPLHESKEILRAGGKLPQLNRGSEQNSGERGNFRIQEGGGGGRRGRVSVQKKVKN